MKQHHGSFTLTDEQLDTLTKVLINLTQGVNMAAGAANLSHQSRQDLQALLQVTMTNINSLSLSNGDPTKS